jgi:hypothetical protein
MTSDAERRELWRERLSALAGSGLTQKQWCEQNGVPVHQLAYWKQRLAGSEPAGTRASGVEWCTTQLVPGGDSVARDLGGKRHLEVRVGGACIEVRTGFDPVLLAGVVRALATLVEPAIAETGRG